MGRGNWQANLSRMRSDDLAMPDIPKITKRLIDEDLAELPKRQIAMLRGELKIYGFAYVKEIARIEKRTSGTMECPMCSQPLNFSIASNGHCAARCSRKGCIRMME